GRDLESYRQLLGQAFARGNRPVRLIGVGVRLLDLQGAHEQLRLF
ncbi:DNA polymerase IV, partial [Pseudomonas aeruginosa]|nr:DNA polymerase IV [Pseudomonas aeruginosa]MCF3998956.1 DNA polymerase IV [Pseudomonas aeruginosa]